MAPSKMVCAIRAWTAPDRAGPVTGRIRPVANHQQSHYSSITYVMGEVEGMGDILIEVDAARSGDLGARRPALPEPLVHRASEIADSVASLAEQFRARLDERLEPPDAATVEPTGEPAARRTLDEVELTFQLSLQAEGGVIIKTAGNATFGVRLTWKTNRG
jgi:hypothetical protein